MMVDVSYQMVLSTLQTVALIVGIAYYIVTLQNQNKSRQAQVYIQIWNKFSDPDFLERRINATNREWTDYADYQEKYGRLQYDDPKEYARNLSIGNAFEGLGVLMSRGFIDPELIAEYIAPEIIWHWEKLQPIISEIRTNLNNSSIFYGEEHLYNKIKPIYMQKQITKT